MLTLACHEQPLSFDDDDGLLHAIVGAPVPCVAGRAGPYSCSAGDLISFLPIAGLGGQSGIRVTDIWGWTDALTGTEYALVARTDGLAFVSLEDPSTPVYLGELPLTPGASVSGWRDVKVYADHAFIVADGAGEHGVQVFDLGLLRSVPNPPLTFEETAHYDGISSAHNIAINETTGYAYVVGASMGGETCGGGLHMIDVSAPTSPTFAGCFSDGTTGVAGLGYTHDTQCVVYDGPDEPYRGHELCFSANETAVSIVDVTDKADPRSIAIATYPQVGYAHQGWLSVDQRFFFQNDEADELTGPLSGTRTLVWDVSVLEDPILVKEHLGVTASSDHNLYVRDRLMYQSNYGSGLRILDVSDPVNPLEVGFFDSVPGDDNRPGLSGSWSNFPFFESGVIVFTSQREGLFVVQGTDLAPPVFAPGRRQ